MLHCNLIFADILHNDGNVKYSFNRDGIGHSHIDHMLVCASVYNKIQQCKIIEEHYLNVSDHLPVLLTLNIMHNEDKGNEMTGTCNTKQTMKWHKATEQGLN